jgi:hypothetical protein
MKKITLPEDSRYYRGTQEGRSNRWSRPPSVALADTLRGWPAERADQRTSGVCCRAWENSAGRTVWIGFAYGKNLPSASKDGLQVASRVLLRESGWVRSSATGLTQRYPRSSSLSPESASCVPVWSAPRVGRHGRISIRLSIPRSNNRGVSVAGATKGCRAEATSWRERVAWPAHQDSAQQVHGMREKCPERGVKKGSERGCKRGQKGVGKAVRKGRIGLRPVAFSARLDTSARNRILQLTLNGDGVRRNCLVAVSAVTTLMTPDGLLTLGVWRFSSRPPPLPA